MNYNSWNDLIYRYYFGCQTGTKVMLHITLQDLIDFAKAENVEIAKGKYASEFSDDFIKRDFVCKFWCSIKDGNPTIKDFENRIIELKRQSITEQNYKCLLAIVAVLIMPICENDDLELHGNEYYGHLLPFLFHNKFINRKGQSVGQLLNNIKLDEIWKYINNWAESEGLPFKSCDVITESGVKHYVRSLMKESLLSPSRLQKFCILFDKGGLVPKVNIENDRLLSAFCNHYQYIGLSLHKFKQLISKDFKEYLVNVLRQEYDNWDGTTKIKERDRKTGKVKIESGNTYYPLFLLLDYDWNSQTAKFGPQLYCSEIDEMDDMTFVTDDTEESLSSVYIKNDGYANKPFCIEENNLNLILKKENGVFSIHEESSQSIKARFVVTDYYLLKVYKNKYVATNEFVKGEYYLFLLRNSAEGLFANWLEENSAICISRGLLGECYNLYEIRSVSTEMPQCNNLHFKSEIRCKSVGNIEVKMGVQEDVVLLSELFAAQFKISGVDVVNDKIYAVSVNSEHRSSTELTYNHEKGLWILKPFKNIFQLNKEFQLYCNESPIPYGKTYKFSDFVLPENFKEVGLDTWGGMTDNSSILGLSLPDDIMQRNLINWNTLQLQMKNADRQEIGNSTYEKTDYMLYALTSASYQTDRWVITMEWIREIRDRIASEYENVELSIESNKFVLQNTLADYFRMGYINYVYTDKGLCLTANHPTLILLSPDYQRNVISSMQGKNIVSKKCTERYYKCLLSGGRTPSLIQEIAKYQSILGYKMEVISDDNLLMPQTIFIHAKERGVFSEIAKKLNLKYQDNIYANALLEMLPSVSDYLTYINNGQERDFWGVPHFRAIDYNRMSEIYSERCSEGRSISNQEINKKDFDKANDFVTFFPGTREEVSVVIKDGCMFEVDKYWGHFIGMSLSDAKVLIHDEDKAQISMPQQIRLPLLYARALTLLTGQTPTSTFGSRTYSIGVNPCTYASASSPDTILGKLGQI